MPFRKPKPLNRDALRDYALRLLGGRAFSIGELKEKLRSRAEIPGDADEVLSRLKQDGLLNDRKLADSYAAARRDNQGQGRVRVLRDLMRRRVPSGVAAKAVEDAYKETDETALIEQFLERKFRNRDLRAELQDPKRLGSAYRKLRLAGFSPGKSIQVLKRYAAEHADSLEGLEEPGAEGES